MFFTFFFFFVDINFVSGLLNVEGFVILRLTNWRFGLILTGEPGTLR